MQGLWRFLNLRAWQDSEPMQGLRRFVNLRAIIAGSGANAEIANLRAIIAGLGANAAIAEVPQSASMAEEPMQGLRRGLNL